MVTDTSTPTRQERRIADLFARDEEFRRCAPLDEVTAVLERPGVPLADLVAAVMAGYADRPALSQRRREVVVDGGTGRSTLQLLNEHDTLTYRQLWERATATATSWAHDEVAALRAGDFLGILGFTSVDYASLLLACVHAGVVAVPLQSGAPADRLRSMWSETRMSVLAVSTEYLSTAVDVALEAPDLRQVIVFDHHPGHDEHRAALSDARARLAGEDHPVTVVVLEELLARAVELVPVPHHTGSGDDLVMLVYTSGSTGTPKGAVYPQRLVAALWRGFQSSVNRIPVVGFNYLPMSHLAGHVSLIGALSRGGVSSFAATSDLSTLFEDLALARPTELNLVPRVCEMLHQLYQGEVSRSADLDAVPLELAERVLQRLREDVLGGRVVRAVCGTAPLAPETAAFMESCLDLELHDGYASTEAGGIMIDTHLLPPVRDYKIVDVPELGYFTTDRPHPRGELLLLTDNIIPGYYQRPELDAGMFDEEGFYRTGDVVAELGPRRIAHLDRRSNVVKLSNGEFVAVAQLESVFTTCPSVHQVFVHGDPTQADLLAVIVPTVQALQEASSDRELRGRLSAELRRAGDQADLHTYEVPVDFLIEREPFTPANGLLSESRKVLRPRLQERYGRALAGLYAEASTRRAEELRLLRESDGPVLEKVLRVVRWQFPRADLSAGSLTRFDVLGGDSLSTVLVAGLLSEVFGVTVPAHLVMSASTNLGDVVDHIETARRDSGQTAGLHRLGTPEVRAEDLTLSAVLGAESRPAGGSVAIVPATTGFVLLTGATGYLGRFVLLEQLSTLPPGGRVVCLVRGSDDDDARARLDQVFSGSPELASRYRSLAAGRLDVLAADIAAPGLGIPAPRWESLAVEVGSVVHVGALVNHVMSYEQLFASNVAGTARLIQLALTARVKPFTFVSTVAAVLPAPLDEDADVREAIPARTLGTGYASGYAASKWAAEVLLRGAHETWGLPVAVMRPSMVLAHPTLPGQLNAADTFSRLLVSIVATGLAPSSFYADTGSGVVAHYDGLPVDFVARAVTTLGRAATGHQTHHLLNPHEDGVSLDTVVDWLIDAGYPVRRIADHRDWVQRVEHALRALPEHQRRQSVLSTLDAYRLPLPPQPGSSLPVTATAEVLDIHCSGGIPHLSRELVEKTLSDLRLLGHLSD